MDAAFVKTYIKGTMVFIPINESEIEELEKMPEGEILNLCISEVQDNDRRSYSQLGTYWAGCKFVSENTEDRNWSTQDDVDEQVKIAVHHVKGWMYYLNQKTGVETLHIKTRSIAFKNLGHLKACGYFDKAFQVLADKVGMGVDEFIDAVKSKMSSKLVG